MPRVSAKKSCLCLSGAAILLVVYTSWPSWNSQKPDEISSTTAFVTVRQKIKRDEVTEITEPPRVLPWFMSGGTVMPRSGSVSSDQMWPGQDPPGDDRITAQLMFKPSAETLPVKTILLFNGLNSWAPHKAGHTAFAHCPVNNCVLTASRAASRRADAILYKDHFIHPSHAKPSRQIWILYLLECPYHTQHVKYNDLFNWTATYRRDSDIVTPYEKFVYYDDSVKQLKKPLKNYAANKTRKVAWFVSNCGARNGRLQYAHELQKHIEVDIFGACGIRKCPRSNQNKCFEMLDNDYKFYLAFENSNCRDYITEKLFVNGLGRDVLPIVMGARPEDYEKSAPLRSYIHVDDFESPKELAEYLHKVDMDDDLYNSYFLWKGTGEFINTHFFCRLCAMLHADDMRVKAYRDINEWWRGPGTCTTGSWRKQQLKSDSKWAAPWSKQR